jgi:hypothetical protein
VLDHSDNSNWQDKLLGGTILTGFVIIAVVSALFTLANWNIETAADSGSSQTTVSSSTHKPTAPLRTKPSG